MRSTAVGLAVLLFSYASAEEDCSAADSRAKALEAKLRQAQEEIASAKAEATDLRQKLQLAQGLQERHEECQRQQDQCQAGQEHSVIGMASAYTGMAGDAVQHLLDQTDLDERAYRHASDTHVMVRDALGMVSSMDLKEFMDKLYKHELYITNIAPVIDTVSAQSQPYIEQYVTPLLEKARPHVDTLRATAGPAMTTAQETLTQVTEQHIPAARDAGSKALSSIPGIVSDQVGTAKERLACLMAPVFSFLEKVSPKSRTILPKSTVDRVLLLICSFFVLLYGFYVMKFSLKITIKVTWFSLSKALLLTVKLPLRLAIMAISWGLYFLTCFGCCGLCRRKKKTAVNGKADQKKAEQKKATAEEIVELLKRANEKKKLESAVKVFCGVAGKGTTMDAKKFGDVVDGKTLDKDVLRKAASTFKELDLKKFGL